MNASFPAGAAAATPPLAVARALELRHGSHVAVRPSDFTLPARRLIAVIGPNGSGKSTLLTALAGLSDPASGALEVLGENPRRRSQRTSFVMQSIGVPQGVPVTVRDVVGMGRYPTLGWFRRFRKEDRDIVGAAMERMQVADLARRHLDQLSGGQRQRAYVAQGLAQGGGRAQRGRGAQSGQLLVVAADALHCPAPGVHGVGGVLHQHALVVRGPFSEGRSPR